MRGSINEYLAEAKENRKQRVNTSKFQIIQNNKVYPGLIVDAWCDEENEEILLEFIVFASSTGVRREVKFKTNSAGVHYYAEICDMFGTDGNPRELIGKAVFLHFEKNGIFQNLRIDEVATKAELRNNLEAMKEEVKPKGKSVKIKKQSAEKKGDSSMDEAFMDFE